MESHALVRSLVASVRFWLGFHACGTSLLYVSLAPKASADGVWLCARGSPAGPMLWPRMWIAGVVGGSCYTVATQPRASRPLDPESVLDGPTSIVASRPAFEPVPFSCDGE